MKAIKRAKLERFPMEDNDRFRLTVVDGNKKTVVWIDRGDVVNLQFDCSTMLLEDDLYQGQENALELAAQP